MLTFSMGHKLFFFILISISNVKKAHWQIITTTFEYFLGSDWGFFKLFFKSPGQHDKVYI